MRGDGVARPLSPGEETALRFAVGPLLATRAGHAGAALQRIILGEPWT